ncbi:MAG: Rrf2 family transcriptional regulator [Chloroflexi bacterium]|nr:Rrf2 family transcriptional regulator [Chloroflexota bacterium]
MRISTRGQYGARALVDLALHYGEGSVLLKDVARRQGISVRYLQLLLTPLIRAGIIKSVRGAHGGVALGRAPEDIRLGEVIELLEGSISPVECVDDPDVCERLSGCVTRDVWAELKIAITGVLNSTTLKDLADRQRQKEQAQVPMYYI